MDRNEAIRAHTGWKKRLTAYLKHPDGSLDPSQVESVNACELGEWIESEGRAEFSTDMAFQHLEVAHSRFHLCAADMTRRADADPRTFQASDLHASDELSRASREVVNSLLALPVLSRPGHHLSRV